jgi:hypothetical protein
MRLHRLRKAPLRSAPLRSAPLRKTLRIWLKAKARK